MGGGTVSVKGGGRERLVGREEVEEDGRGRMVGREENRREREREEDGE